MSEFEFKSRSCWEVYEGEGHQTEMEALAGRYLDFLSQCKTERETVEYLGERLAKAGYLPSYMGGKVIRGIQGKAMFAARRGKLPLSQGVQLICAHADAPRLDLKQHPLQEQCNVGQAKTHYYGGIRKYQWFARPLALHGVIAKSDGTTVKVVLGEDAEDPVFSIADLLPHLAAKQSEQTLANAFEAEKMNIILGHQPLGKSALEQAKAAPEVGSQPECPDRSGEKKEKEPVKAMILQLLHEKYGIIEEDLYSAELQVVPAGRARRVGLDRALLGGYGQDDRICVFSGLEALLAGGEETPQHTQCLMIWDKEEIGSEGSTGAKSRFFEYCMQDMLSAWEPTAKFSEVMLRSRGISADVHAATDPDWQDLHEKLNAALIGHGPCFCKFTGSRGKYSANDAHAEYVGWLRGVMNAAGVPWQMAELGKVDGGGGGTVAMHLAAYGMNIIDCGPPILSMHSPFEISSKADLYATCKAFAAFFGA